MTRRPLPVSSFARRATLALALATLVGCGGGGGGDGGGSTGGGTVTPPTVTPTAITLTSVQLSGSIATPLAGQTVRVLVDGVPATLSGGGWTATITVSNPDQPVTIAKEVNGTVVTQRVVTIRSQTL